MGDRRRRAAAEVAEDLVKRVHLAQLVRLHLRRVGELALHRAEDLHALDAVDAEVRLEVAGEISKPVVPSFVGIEFAQIRELLQLVGRGG